MKTISIGRDESCDIVIIDKTNVVSRRHAVIIIDNAGKMTITDYSSNGTYINGIRMSENVAVPITRKDTISLAHASELNWDLVPNIKGRNVKIVSISAFLLVLIIALLFVFRNEPEPINYQNEPNQESAPQNNIPDDSVIKPEPKIDEQETPAPKPAPAPEPKKPRNKDKEVKKPQDNKPVVKEDKTVVEESAPVNPIIF